jgi:ribosomal protein S18 acetylase RimI-like enzyme
VTAKLKLVPMKAAEFEPWRNEQVEAYGQGHVRAGTWDATRATALSSAEFDRLLPQGLETPGHSLRFLVDAASGDTVGSVWWFIAPAPEPGVVRSLFIYWIGVDARFRRKGFGRAALEELERVAADAGVRSIGLFVFADNPGAIELYRSFGFEPKGMGMRKALGPATP